MNGWKYDSYMTVPDYAGEGEGISFRVNHEGMLYLSLSATEPTNSYGCEWHLNQVCLSMDRATGNRLLVALAQALLETK